MMRTDQTKKVIIKIDSDVNQENVKNTRKTLRTLQPTAKDKENLTGRILISKEAKSFVENEHKKQKPLLMHKETQTEKYVTDINDLTSEEASLEYWKRLAEKRQESLDDSLQEIEKLKENIEVLQEENKVCKEMLEESRHLVEILQEMINEGDSEETPEDKSENPEKDNSGEETK